MTQQLKSTYFYVLVHRPQTFRELDILLIIAKLMSHQSGRDTIPINDRVCIRRNVTVA